MKKILLLFFLFEVSLFSSAQEKVLFTTLEKTDDLSDKEKVLYNLISSNKTTTRYAFININREILSQKEFDFYIFETKYIATDVIIEARQPNNFSLFAKIKGVEGYIILTILDGDILGNIFIDKQYYEIKTIGSEKFVLREYNQKKYSSEGCFHNSEIKTNNSNGDIKDEPLLDQVEIVNKTDQTQASGNVKCYLRLLVVYTPAVSSNVYDPRNLCQQSIDLMNQTFLNSGINHRVELAYCGEINYIESDDCSQDVNRMANGSDGFMDNVFQLRSDFAADICILLSTSTNGGTLCGTSKAIYADKANTFCQVFYDCAVNNISFPHEIGHLLGARHNIDGSTTPFASGHGFQNTNKGWRTIMAVRDNCCTRLPYWSNPNISWGGDPMGNSSTANNSGVLNSTIIDTKAFRVPSSNLAVSSITLDAKNYADYVASTSISTNLNNNVVVLSGSDVSMRAGVEITLNSGFVASGNFVAEIDPIDNCGGNSEAGGTANGGQIFDGGLEDKQNMSIKNNTLRAYPNPTKQSLEIEYSTSENANNSLQIVDILGKNIGTIFENKHQMRGTHLYQYQFTQASSGIYFIKLSNGSQVSFLKISLVN